MVEEAGQRFEIGQGACIIFFLMQQRAAMQEGRRLILLPGGTVPGIGVQIANSHGSRRVVRLDPMTGYPRIESVGKSE